MSLFQYNTGIPAGPNNPSQDQPDMLINTDSIDGLIDVDHIGFNENLGGYHDVIHQPPQVASPGTVAGIGQTYTKTITGDEQLFYKSGLGVETQITGGQGSVVAAVNFSVGPSPTFTITTNNSINIASVTRNFGTGLYFISFTNALPSAFYYYSGLADNSCVVTNAGGASTTLFAIDTWDVNTGALKDPTNVSCVFTL